MAVDSIDTQHPIDRLPPQNPEAEEAVLGSLLMDPEAVGRVAPFLRPEDFYRERNGAIYAAMLAVYDRREPVDFLTVTDELQRRGRYDEMGGLAYLSHLVGVVPTAVHVEQYAHIVERTAVKRRLITAAGKIAAVAYDDSLDLDTTLEKAEQLLFGVSQRRVTKDFEPLGAILGDYLQQMELRAAGKEGRGVPSGFIDLDKLTGGLQRSDLIILAARPSVGKSAWALNIVQNAALRYNATCAIFSLEMSKQQLAHRLLCAESGVDATKLRLAMINEGERRKLHRALEVLSGAPIYIDDTPSISVTEMRSKARRLHAEATIDLVVMDYLQLATTGGRYGDNRVQEISEISRSMKAMARELDCPVLALSQLSRAVESRTPHIPMLSDLRESGSLEQDADIVLFIYREEMYDKDTEKKGIADIFVSKHRNGPTGQFSLLFMDKTTRFVDLEAYRND